MVSARVSRRLTSVAYICQAVLDVPFPSVGGRPCSSRPGASFGCATRSDVGRGRITDTEG